MKGIITRIPWPRRFQFRLRTLFIATALVAAVLGVSISELPKRVVEEFDSPCAGMDYYVKIDYAGSRNDLFPIWVTLKSDSQFALEIRHRRCETLWKTDELTRPVFDEDISAPVRIASSSRWLGYNAVVELRIECGTDGVFVVNERDGTRHLLYRGSPSGYRKGQRRFQTTRKAASRVWANKADNYRAFDIGFIFAYCEEVLGSPSIARADAHAQLDEFSYYAFPISEDAESGTDPQE